MSEKRGSGGLTGLAVTALGLALLSSFASQGAEPPAAAPATAGPLRGLPSLEATHPLPPIPERSDRNANYTMEARLDPEKHVLDGRLTLEWRNTSGIALDAFPFHLYWNAFRNNLSTSSRGEGRRAFKPKAPEKDRSFGWIHVTSVHLLGESPADLLPTLRYLHPDDENAQDRTVMEVRTPAPVAPGATARFAIEWTSRIPYGDVGRAGWVHDYNFIVQWFPKIGVYWKGAWNAHQFHPWSEFFADYGTYDVTLTLPQGFVVGATGLKKEERRNTDGTQTLRFVQDDVHDFAWTASRRFLEYKDRFADPGYPPVDLRLLLQPEHAHLATRYLEATKISLRGYGAWSAPYPYPQLTVVDPAWNSASGGMEYPTLFTGGANYWAPQALESPDSVTIHEAGHQFWYALVGNNEFEEAWLDEGFNSYHEEKALRLFLGPSGWGRRYFGPQSGRGSRSGWPVVAPGVWSFRGEADLSGLRRSGKTDAMARRSWEYRTVDAYGLNSYGKPSLSLQTLENLVGDDVMTQILRTYARRYRFRHPASEDFIAVVNEVTGKDYRWYFDQTWYSSDLCDYAIAVNNEKARVAEGFVDGKDGAPVPAPELAKDAPKETPKGSATEESGPFDSEVTVKRLGEVRMPVEVLVQFEDGRSVTEAWDGQYRWTRFRYHGPSKVRRAVVDPEGKLAIDIDPANNSWVKDTGQARRAATKWSARLLFWLQNLLELHTVLG